MTPSRPSPRTCVHPFIYPSSRTALARAADLAASRLSVSGFRHSLVFMVTTDAIIPAERLELSPYSPTRSTVAGTPLGGEELRQIEIYWRACNYLSLGMIYLRENPLLVEPLRPEHIKNRLLGHWGSSPGLSFIYVHLNRLIKKYDLDMIFLAGPGHGAPGVLGPAYLEGTYSEFYPEKSQDVDGLGEFFRQFSFPGGIGSHCTPEMPGSIHEGGELGYVLSHACGAAFDNPERSEERRVGKECRSRWSPYH